MVDAMQAARRHGAIVSYDLNYRASLWHANGGKQAHAVNRRMAWSTGDDHSRRHVDGDARRSAAADGWTRGADHEVKRHEVRERILETGILPVVRASSPDWAAEVSRAICAGGIPIIEMTLTVPGAIEIIAELSRSMPGLLIGAGTVLDATNAQRCIDAGAQFLVSPGLDAATIKLAGERNVLMIGGALTPSEVMRAWKLGCDFVKIFPCASVGGPSYISALKTVLPHIRMVPTGGVSLSNAGAFFSAGAEAIGVGGELTSAASITEAACQFVSIVKGAKQ